MKKQNLDIFLKYLFLFMLACVIGRIYEFDLIISEGTLNYLKHFPTAIYTFIFSLPYGVAGLILYKLAKVMEKYKVKKVLQVIACVAVINLIELGAGLIALKGFGVMPWDYSHHFMNYLGLISVPITVRWLIFTLLLGFFAYKPAKQFLKKPLSKNIKKITTVSLIIYAIYLITILSLKCVGII